MSGKWHHRSRAWAFVAVAVIAAGMARPAPTLAVRSPGSALDSAGLVRPPSSILPNAAHAVAPAGPDYPGALWEPANPANYTVADRPYTNPVTRIIIHVAEGGWASTYTWFRNAAAEASANYVVSATGRVAQMVPDKDIAWHAGNWAYNETSIGIEHAGFTNVTHFPDAQYRGSAKLAAWLADTYLITPDRKHVIGHYQVPDPDHPGQWGGVDHHTDPGRTWDWPRYMAYLRSDAHDTYQQVVDNADPTGVRFDPSVWQVESTQSGRYGRNYLAAAPGHTDSPVTFRLAVPATDHYDLMMRWPCGADSSRVGVSVLAARGLRTSDRRRGSRLRPVPVRGQLRPARRGRVAAAGELGVARPRDDRRGRVQARRAVRSDPAHRARRDRHRGRDEHRPALDEGAGQHRGRRLPRAGRLGPALPGHRPHAGGDRPRVRQRAHHLGARARHGVEPLAAAAALDSHRRLPTAAHWG